MKPFHTPKSKQNPGHFFSPFVATEWSMDQLAPFCKLFPLYKTNKGNLFMILEKPEFFSRKNCKRCYGLCMASWLLKSLMILLDRWRGKMMLRLPMGLSGLLDGLSPTGTTQAQNGPLKFSHTCLVWWTKKD